MTQRIIVAVFITMSLVPLLSGYTYALLYSFGLTGLLNSEFTLHYWKSLFLQHQLLKHLWFSIYTAAISMLFSLIVAFYFAYQLLHQPRIWIIKSLLLPVFFAPISAAFIFNYLLSSTGIISRICFALGWINSYNDFPIFTQDKLGVGIIIPHIFLLFPLFSLLFYNIAKKENLMALKDLSLNLGASSKKFVFKIFIPILLKKTEPIILLYFIFFIGAYEIPLYLGTQSPQMLTVWIADLYRKFDLNSMGTAYAIIVLYASFVLVLLSIYLLKRKNKLLF